MNPRLWILFVLVPVSLLSAQTSLEAIDLDQGPYAVGFQHYTATDSTRSYRIHNAFNKQQIKRPIPISMWYPATPTPTAETLTVLDYLEVLKAEEEWEHLPNYFLLDWFPYLWNTPENQAHLSEQVQAYSSTTPLAGPFPVIVYAPSYQDSSIENFALFEYLASQGFVVLSSPSRGTETRWLSGGTTKDMETQARDVEFLLKELHRFPQINPNRIALMGFSFGGLANALTVMRNPGISALLSLDGTERYNYPVLAASSYFDLERLDIPYAHLAQKVIPEDVLKSDKIPAELNTEFPLYDSLTQSSVYRYRFHDLTHSYFSSFGVLFANRDPRQDKSEAEIMASYKLLAEHSLQFLKATLEQDAAAIRFLENSPSQNNIPEQLLSKSLKKPQGADFDYRDFNDLAVGQDYKGLIPLYQQVIAKHPELHLEEGMLNTLGLHLSFDPQRGEQGLRVFALALYLYPESANLYDSLAEAHFYQNNMEEAILNFEKSLALNPNNQNAINRLRALRN
ncbi:prolyl oligopeptidase family serine peptidase [Croceiramulus getboli]|nr:prolyl oligopeptidase family serine peptidase [Flavobacteriaceae bacterium YJPT1-3]